jgi:hypothetical protein
MVGLNFRTGMNPLWKGQQEYPPSYLSKRIPKKVFSDSYFVLADPFLQMTNSAASVHDPCVTRQDFYYISCIAEKL